MIGLVMRSVVGDSMGACGSLLMPIIAVAAICGVVHCCNCRMRDIGCIKRCLRSTGTDPFDEFEIMVLVHNAKFTSKSKPHVLVRIIAGDQVVETDPDPHANFQQALCVFVEQGTEELRFELVDSSNTILAELKFDIMKDILKDANNDGNIDTVVEKTFTMKQKQKGILNPRLQLTFSPEGQGDEERALLSGLNASSETEWIIQKQMTKTVTEAVGKGNEPPKSELELLSQGCHGPLCMFKNYGNTEDVYVGVLGPPLKKKYALHIWNSEREKDKGNPPKQSIELLRVSSVNPDPSRPDVFVVNHIDKSKMPQIATFTRVDRGRDVWVELLQILVTKVHEEYKSKKSPGKH